MDLYEKYLALAQRLKVGEDKIGDWVEQKVKEEKEEQKVKEEKEAERLREEKQRLREEKKV